ncbi:8355_t:CDS:2 [Dentiscutata erythropus]|uniref:8355_t:CDS:1 n=1 Tax=Dentiscutata erythropus TaxID=1348616 RepID=A0A9N9JLJ2_9GLOM|nr:8355_t:CDS:2 [Dentiscutata erythropus]
MTKADPTTQADIAIRAIRCAAEHRQWEEALVHIFYLELISSLDISALSTCIAPNRPLSQKFANYPVMILRPYWSNLALGTRK